MRLVLITSILIRWSSAATTTASRMSWRKVSSCSGVPEISLTALVSGSMGERCSTMSPSGASTRALPLGTWTLGVYRAAVRPIISMLRKMRLVSTVNPELRNFHSQRNGRKRM